MRRVIAFTGTSLAAAAGLGLMAGYVVGSVTAPRPRAVYAPMSCILRPMPTGDIRPAAWEPLRGLCVVAGGGR